MQDVAAAVARRRAELGGGPLAVSRASWLRDGPELIDSVPAAVVGGQTVWTATGTPVALALVEQPNWFGRIERQPTGSLSVITIRWWADAGAAADISADQHSGDVAAARNLAGRLRQLPGVTLPHGHPESPWFIVSFPGNAKATAAQLEGAGFPGCRVLGSGYPEFPGGMRIEVAWLRAANELFATTVENAITQ